MNSIAQLLFILSRTSGSNMGPCETSQDSSLLIICFIVKHISPNSTVMLTVWSDFSEKLSRNSLHFHISQLCHSVDGKQLNLQHVTLQSSTTTELFHQPTLMHNFLYSLTICLLHYYPL